jgi:hypothetical protein
VVTFAAVVVTVFQVVPFVEIWITKPVSVTDVSLQVSATRARLPCREAVPAKLAGAVGGVVRLAVLEDPEKPAALLAYTLYV